METAMNIYSMLINELSTKKIIYATVIVAHLIVALFCWVIDSSFYFVIPSLCIATIFFTSFSLLNKKSKKTNLRFLFYFYNRENKKKELISNLKYLLLMTLLINLILLFSTLVVINFMLFDKNYLLLILLGSLLSYGLFEYYRFTITEIMSLVGMNKACNNNKELKQEVMKKLDLNYSDIESFLYNINRSAFNDCEIYSFCNHQLIISLENGYVFMPRKVPIQTFKTYLKENNIVIEALTKEDILVMEMFSY
jgi:hypothetical protein